MATKLRNCDFKSPTIDEKLNTAKVPECDQFTTKHKPKDNNRLYDYKKSNLVFGQLNQIYN